MPEDGINCYWCPDCMEHLACIIGSKDVGIQEHEAKRLEERIASHQEVCSKSLL